MKTSTSLVVTSISAPGPILHSLAELCRRDDYEFILIGDAASPPEFALEGCRFYGLREQQELPFRFARLCPQKHYARKNIGYLLAAQRGAQRILETDDDNAPLETFGALKGETVQGRHIADAGWVNLYSYFTRAGKPLWPRGFPLSLLKKTAPAADSLPVKRLACPIQQGIVQGNPDVDAVWRLVLGEPVEFEPEARSLILGKRSWCPFNSQNTAWFREAFGLMYLPSFCSFRMTDIWRSFIAQRIAWECGWGGLFHEPTMFQQRNEHNLMKDFEDEIPGYLFNGRLCEELDVLELKAGREHLLTNLRRCYEMMVSRIFIAGEELGLLDAWIADLSEIGS